MAYHWLGLLPKAARLDRAPVHFESHLFRIALQYRSGLPCVPKQVWGGATGGKGRGENEDGEVKNSYITIKHT